MEQEETKSVRPDGAKTTGPQSLDPQATDKEQARRLEEELRRMPVRDHLLLMMHSLSDLALTRLGLLGKSDLSRDLDQARLAIEGFRALLGVVETASSSQDLSAHRDILAQLQLAYAAAVGAPTQKSDREGESSAEQPAGAADRGQSQGES